MTREEAIVELKAYMESDCYLDAPSNEACSIAINALRPVSREQVEKVWRGEWKCHGDCGVTECPACGWSIEEYVGDYNFCPNCGAPMTNEAVQMVMRRLEALKDGNDDFCSHGERKGEEE